MYVLLLFQRYRMQNLIVAIFFCILGHFFGNERRHNIITQHLLYLVKVVCRCYAFYCHHKLLKLSSNVYIRRVKVQLDLKSWGNHTNPDLKIQDCRTSCRIHFQYQCLICVSLNAYCVILNTCSTGQIFYMQICPCCVYMSDYSFFPKYGFCHVRSLLSC